MNELDRLAVVGDEVHVDGGTLRVERLDGRRVDRLRFTPDADTDPARYAERRNTVERSENSGSPDRSEAGREADRA
jgi:hypothetical protein